MAATTTESTQYARSAGTSTGYNMPTDYSGDVRIFAFDFSQSGAGDQNSIGKLSMLPSGKIRILDIEFNHDAMGGAIDVGHDAYTDETGTTVAADRDAFKAASATTSAGTKRIFVNKVFHSRDGIPVWFMTNAVGPLPDGATMNGVIRAVTL